MPVHVGSFESQVEMPSGDGAATAPPAAPEAGASSGGAGGERTLYEQQRRLARDLARTFAEGHAD